MYLPNETLAYIWKAYRNHIIERDNVSIAMERIIACE